MPCKVWQTRFAGPGTPGIWVYCAYGKYLRRLYLSWLSSRAAFECLFSWFCRLPPKMSDLGLLFLWKTSYRLTQILNLFLVFRLATSAAINLPLEPLKLLNLTSLYIPKSSYPQCYCTDSASWMMPESKREDCQAAIVRMRRTEVVAHDGLPIMQAPWTYISGE